MFRLVQSGVRLSLAADLGYSFRMKRFDSLLSAWGCCPLELPRGGAARSRLLTLAYHPLVAPDIAAPDPGSRHWGPRCQKHVYLPRNGLFQGSAVGMARRRGVGCPPS